MIIVLKSGSTDAEVAGRRVGASGPWATRPTRSAASCEPSSAPSATTAARSGCARWSRSNAWSRSRRSCSPSSWPAGRCGGRTPQVRVGRRRRSAGDAIVVMAGPCSVESRLQVLDVAAQVKAAGRQRPARRRVQAAHLALRLPGARGRRAQAPGRGPARDGPAGRHRGDGARQGRARRRARRHPPDRRPQRAELLAAQARGRDAASPCSSSAACPRPSRSGCSRRSTCWRAAIRTSSCASAGIRTFETATRFTLDLNAVPVVKKLTHLPVVVDPSHGTGHWEYVESMALAAWRPAPTG